MKKIKNLFKDTDNPVISSQKLPSFTDPEAVGKAVISIWKDYKPQFDKWRKAVKNNWDYYKGDGPGRYRDGDSGNDSDYNHNLIFSNTEISTPIIERSLAKPIIFSEENVELGELLDMRTSQSLSDTGLLDEHASDMIHGVTVGGTQYFKIFWDSENKQASATLLSTDRVCHGMLGLPFENSIFFIDHTEITAGQLNDLIAISLNESNIYSVDKQKLDTIKKDGIPNMGTLGMSEDGSSPKMKMSPFGGTYNKESVFSSYTDPKINKITKLECWFDDISLDSRGDRMYPAGRVVVVCIGESEKGMIGTTIKDMSNPFPVLGPIPFAQALCHRVPESPFGFSEVEPMIDPQERINETINLLHDNLRYSGNPIKVFDTMNGQLTLDNIPTAPGGAIGVDLREEGKSLSDIIYNVSAPNISGNIMPVLSNYLYLASDTSGVSDVAKGTTSRLDTSGAAIMRLQDKSDTRFIYIARNLNHTLKNIYYRMGLLNQYMDAALAKEMIILDTNTGKQRKYNAQELASLKFKVGINRKMRPEDALSLLSAALQLEAKLPGSGDLLLRYVDDKSLRLSFIKIKNDFMEQQKLMAAQEQQRQDELAKQQRDEIKVQAMKLAQQNNKNK